MDIIRRYWQKMGAKNKNSAVFVFSHHVPTSPAANSLEKGGLPDLTQIRTTLVVGFCYTEVSSSNHLAGGSLLVNSKLPEAYHIAQ